MGRVAIVCNITASGYPSIQRINNEQLSIARAVDTYLTIMRLQLLQLQDAAAADADIQRTDIANRIDCIDTLNSS